MIAVPGGLEMARRTAARGFAAASILLVGLALGAPSPTHAQAAQSAEPTVQQGIQELRQQNFAEAAEILAAVVEREPENGRALMLLASAHHSLEHWDESIRLHREAAEKFDQFAPNALYNVGAAHARKGDADAAFQWLFRAKETGRINMTGVDLDQDLEALRDDPRYQELFPSEAEYADPFVEVAHIIHEWVGEAVGDQFGWIARNVGDVDGDGVDDLTTSAPTNDQGGEDAGKVYVYSGRTGELLWSVLGDTPGAQLGLGIEAAGDVNADGIPDVGAGAPAQGPGTVFIYSGDDGRVLLELEGESDGDFYGRRVADLGDLTGDGHGEILVGAPRATVSGEQAVGKAYVYSGADGSLLMEWEGPGAGARFGAAGAGMTRDGQSFIVVGAPGGGSGGATYVYDGLSPEPAFVIEADETGAQLGGMFVSVLGDVDGDDVLDVYASDWANQAKGPSTGRIYVHSGATGERIATITGEAQGDGFGIGPADAGDVDGDGHADLVVGAWQHAGAAPSGGKVYLYSGKDRSLIRAWTGKVPGETFGFDATGMGDVNGDGVVDLLLTSAWSGINGSRSGRMFVVSGR